MKIQTIRWQDALPIRHQVLWPNKTPEFCKIEDDESGYHYGAFINDKLVCVASIYIENQSARLRKFATLENYQGKGIGSKVLTYILQELADIDITYFWCDARTTALDFYQRFGLEKEGSVFEKSGIAYYKMAMKINRHT
ncbi:GNAT family N-acetyltransferase [Psychromonas sp. KJ10-10]|uniref:GNAT family N-acetyltransferase n=1 Tax=Psychromonas sp. KJ10-10 TaxID=3391823 RepID=UPI0039B67400